MIDGYALQSDERVCTAADSREEELVRQNLETAIHGMFMCC